MNLNLYNQVDYKISFDKLEKFFPKGVEIGVKNPYLKVTQAGTINLRNDNPCNVVFQEKKKKVDPNLLKDLGNKFFQMGKFVQAIKAYQDAMENTSDPHLRMILYSNTAQICIEL